MTNKKINSLQICCLVTFIIISTVTGIGMTNIINIAGKDAYLSVIVAGILGFIMVFIIMKVNDNNNNLNFSEIVNKVCGKYIGFVVNVIINFFVIVIGIVTMYSISNFIVSQFLSDLPIMAMSIVLGVIIWYAVVKGIEVMSRTGLILLVITLVLFLIASFTLGPQIEIDNIKPFIENGVKNPLIGGITLFLTNIVPIFLVMSIPRDRIIDKEKYNKYLIGFYTLGILMAFTTTFITILVLGNNLASMFQYPEYIVLKKVSLFGFLDRIENIISIQWIFRCFMMIGMVVYYLSNSIKRDNNSRLLPLVILAVIITISLIYFKNNTMFGEFILNKYPYLNLALFIIIFIVSVLKVIKDKKIARDN